MLRNNRQVSRMHKRHLFTQFYKLVCLLALAKFIPTQSSLSSSLINGRREGQPPFEIFETEPPTSSGQPIIFEVGLKLICRVNVTSSCPTVNWAWEQNGKKWQPFNLTNDDMTNTKTTQIAMTEMDNVGSTYTCVAKCSTNTHELGPEGNRTFYVGRGHEQLKIVTEEPDVKNTVYMKWLMLTLLPISSLLLLLCMLCLKPKKFKRDNGEETEMTLDQEQIDIFHNGRPAPSQKAQKGHGLRRKMDFCLFKMLDEPSNEGSEPSPECVPEIFSRRSGRVFRPDETLECPDAPSTSQQATAAIEENYFQSQYDYSRIPYDKSKEIPFEELKFSIIIGDGQFGEVRLATFHNRLVAVKSIKKDSGMSMAQIKAVFLDFIHKEIKINQFVGSHDNLVGYIGAVTEQLAMCEAYLVLDYCVGGDLATFLKNFKDRFQSVRLWSDPPTNSQAPFNTIHLLRWANDIANGLKHLTELGIPHNDLAARNILLDKRQPNFQFEPFNSVAKIGDYGLSRMFSDATSFNTKCYPFLNPNDPHHKERAVPIYSMSPEAIKFRQWTLKNDIWALGVVYWEMFSFEKTPYENVNRSPSFTFTIRLQQFLQNGGRLDEPSEAPKEIWSIMERCWALEPTHRPKITEIVQGLEQLDDQIKTWLENSVEQIEEEEEGRLRWEKAAVDTMPRSGENKNFNEVVKAEADQGVSTSQPMTSENPHRYYPIDSIY